MNDMTQNDLGANEPLVRALRALKAAAIAAGPEAVAALVYLAERTLAAAGEAEAADMDAQEADDSREALCIAEDRMADLERLIAGYRARCAGLVRRLRTRQRLDPDPSRDLRVVECRRAEDVAIDCAHLLDAWALNVITGGECCAEASPPPDWADLRNFVAVVSAPRQAVGHE